MRRTSLTPMLLVAGLAGIVAAFLAAGSEGQTPAGPFKITIKDGKPIAGELVLPIDRTQRAVAQHSGGFAFGIKLNGNRISFGEQDSMWCHLRVDGQEFQLGFFPGIGGQGQAKPLPPGKTGKKRIGFEAIWTNGEVKVTQTVELVPGKATVKPAASILRMDTYRVSYIVENVAKDNRARKIEFKSCIDTLIVENDGALFASPTTHPGKILNGMILRGKQIPDYMQVLERPDLNNPGVVATLTLKHNKGGDNPDTFIMTNTLSIFQGWEPPAQEAGDSACCMIWNATSIKPGESRTMVFAYGGGQASDPESEGRVALALGGSLEPGKLFTISAVVDDPAPGQALTLELPPGIERVEGKELQPVPPPSESNTSVVLWKARVLQPGDYDIRVRSSTGVTQVKTVSIQPIGR